MTTQESKEFSDILRSVRRDTDDMAARVKSAEERAGRLALDNEELQRSVGALRKASLGGGTRTLQRRAGQFVSDDCARHIASIVILGAERHGKLKDAAGDSHGELVRMCSEILGVQSKTALTTSDIPLPVGYSSEVVELVWEYGQARQHGTVYPLGSGSVKLPRLGASPAFGFLTQSAAIGEKSPGFENISFNAEKAGGIIRLPSEIDADSIVSLGQFLGRYVAREMAKWEDTVFYTADGSGTYKSMKGLTKAALDLNKKVVLASTKTKPSDITLADLRALRSKVHAKALSRGAYHVHASHEPALAAFNTSSTVMPYTNGPAGPRLDGFPIHWVDVLPVYSESAAASQLQLVFGDVSYQYLGERAGVSIETSQDVYFATDEIAVRALERFCVGLMADDAVAVLQLAAS